VSKETQAEIKWPEYKEWAADKDLPWELKEGIPVDFQGWDWIGRVVVYQFHQPGFAEAHLPASLVTLTPDWRPDWVNGHDKQ
jgi:hypothetical protein